jgi:hypothetical protein
MELISVFAFSGLRFNSVIHTCLLLMKHVPNKSICVADITSHQPPNVVPIPVVLASRNAQPNEASTSVTVFNANVSSCFRVSSPYLIVQELLLFPHRYSHSRRRMRPLFRVYNACVSSVQWNLYAVLLF